MFAAATPELFHIVCYVTGATLYAMLLVMVACTWERADSITLGTAILGLSWNVAATPVYAA